MVVLDRQTAGRESSWAGGGILTPLYPWRYEASISRLARWSQQHYPGLCQDLAARTGVDPQYERTGMLLTADKQESSRALNWAQEFNQALESVTSAQAHELEPQLGEIPAQFLWMKNCAHVRNPRLLAAIRRDLELNGVEIHENSEVQGFDIQADAITRVITCDGKLDASACVIAAGAWTGRLVKSLDVSLPIEPVRGQMLVYNTPPGTIHRMILHQSRYLIPRRDGRVLVGSTLEYDDFEKIVTDEARLSLQKSAELLAPILNNSVVEHHWAGLRPGSPGGRPFIGRHPSLTNTYVCSGHFRNGLVLAPASARLMVDLMLERAPIVDPGPYALPRPGRNGFDHLYSF